MSRSSAQLERQAEQIRAELTGTIDELRSRLTVGEFVDQAMDYAGKGHVGEFVRNLGRDVRQNPLPLALVGAGLAWLMVANRSAPRRAEAGASGEASGAASRAQTAAAPGTSIGETGRAAVETGRNLVDFCKEQPWVLAGIGVALGAALGGALPAARPEDQLVGASGEVKANLHRGPAPGDVQAVSGREQPGDADDPALAGSIVPSGSESMPATSHEPRSLDEVQHHPGSAAGSP